MKKLFSSILISFILITNLVLPISLFADTTVWNYTETVGLKTKHGPFTTQDDCIKDLNKLNPLLKPTMCLPSTIAGLPIPPADPAVPVTGQVDVPENKSIYTMLAPIGGITRMDSSGTDATCAADPKCITNDIGKYLNIIFKLAIGVSAALAVIMLIINGITYMGDESIFAKTEAKSKMFSAILGLLIALGSWALLNTISPALTGKGGFTIDSADIKIVPLYDRGSTDPKQANGESTNCKVVPSGPCSVANLTTIFGAEKAVAMSKICSMESSGRENLASGTDVCKPVNTALGTTNPFSFGLFQVNLSANGKLAGPECVGLFDKAVIGGDAIEPKYTSGYNCKILPGKEALYNTCKARLLDTNTNLAIAKSLFNNSYGMGNWTGDKKFCASAFQ